MTNKDNENKELNESKKDKIEEETKDKEKEEKLVYSGHMTFNPEDLKDLDKMFEQLKELEKKESKVKKFFSVFLIFFMKVIIFSIINVATFGLLHKFIEFDNWYSVLFYILGLSVFTVGLGLILTCIKRLLFNPIILLILRFLIIIAVMIVFNYLPQEYFVFNGILELIFYYLLAYILYQILNNYIVKFLLRKGVK